jgi:hypothetical protein
LGKTSLQHVNIRSQHALSWFLDTQEGENK